MVIYREMRGDEATLTGVGPDAAFLASTFSTGGATANYGTIGGGSDLICPVNKSLKMVVLPNNGTTIGNATAGWTTSLSSGWMSAYFKVVAPQRVHAKQIRILRAYNGGNVWEYFLTDVFGTDYLNWRNNDEDGDTGIAIVPGKVYFIEFYFSISNGANSVFQGWFAEGDDPPRMVIDDATGTIFGSTLTTFRCGISTTADAADRNCEVHFAGVALTDARRGHLQMRRGRHNRQLPNSGRTWRHGPRRGKETGLVVV